jgi:hypothetical protein
MNNYDTVRLANRQIDNLCFAYSNDYEGLLQKANLSKLDSNVLKELKDNEIILNEYYRKKYFLKEGDVITIEREWKNNDYVLKKAMNFSIVGFSDVTIFDNNTAFISSNMGKKMSMYLFGSYDHIEYFLQLKDNSKEAYTNTKKIIMSQYMS